eukprot:s1586_g27.t1
MLKEFAFLGESDLVGLCQGDSKSWKCKHKPLFGTEAGADVAAAIVFFLISGLALSAGIGGGGLYVPLLMVMLGFPVHEATAVSQACLAGGPSSALIYNLRQRHPQGHKPMIDYDLVLIMGPNLLLGAMVGSVMNFSLPSWLILILLISILVHSAYKTFKKAVQTLRKERLGQVAGRRGEDRLSKNPIERCLRLFGLGKRYDEFENSSKTTPSTLGRTVDTGDVKLDLDLGGGSGTLSKAVDDATPSDVTSVQSTAVTVAAEMQPQYPRGKLAGFLLMWSIVVVSILLRGGRASPGMALNGELRQAWGQSGTRVLGCDILTSTVRQVRALRRLGIAGAGRSRASSPVGAPPRRPAPPTAAEASTPAPVEPAAPAEENKDEEKKGPEEKKPEEAPADAKPPETEVKEEAADGSSEYTDSGEESDHPDRAAEEDKRPSSAQAGLKPAPKPASSPRRERERSDHREDLPRRRVTDRRGSDHHESGGRRGIANTEAPFAPLKGAMARRSRGSGEGASHLVLSADEGAEVRVCTPEWAALLLPVGAILEVGIHGSSVGLGQEAWFAMSIESAATHLAEGVQVSGTFMGTEDETTSAEISDLLLEGAVHLCPDDPCPTTDIHALHATVVRVWRPANFSATYLNAVGKAKLKSLIAEEKKLSKKATTAAATRKRPATDPPAPKLSRRAAKEDPPPRPGPIHVPSDAEEDSAPVLDGDGTAPGVDRTQLRGILKSARERILGGGAGNSRARADKDATPGLREGATGSVARPGLVAGTSLNPGRQAALQLAPSGDSRGDSSSHWMKKLAGKTDAGSALLAQAAQTSAREARLRKEKKKSKDKDDPLRQLVSLLKGKGSSRKKSKKKKDKEKGHRRVSWDIKTDPDPPDSSGSGGSSSSGSGGSRGKRSRSDSDSDLSYEPPLRKKALKAPGSVMELLVKHAQLQLDRGALLETEGAEASITTGVKISTYFALLIRPFHVAGSPLLRELYALGQAIDLLRMGKLPETADALASRFIAVHTALTEGSWGTAAQLELYPLEPTQSANTAVMLEAQKHRRLVLKSQGLPVSQGWWPSSGRGKGGTPRDKGKKGDPKGRGGRGKGKGSKEQQWSGGKGDANAWRENKEESPKK